MHTEVIFRPVREWNLLSVVMKYDVNAHLHSGRVNCGGKHRCYVLLLMIIIHVRLKLIPCDFYGSDLEG